MYYGSSFPNNNNQMTIQNNQFPIDTNKNQIQTPNKIKKKVNFNNQVDVINVESYKQFNKIDDEYYNQLLLNAYATSLTNNTKPKNKKDCDCSCIIM